MNEKTKQNVHIKELISFDIIKQYSFIEIFFCKDLILDEMYILYCNSISQGTYCVVYCTDMQCSPRMWSFPCTLLQNLAASLQ